MTQTQAPKYKALKECVFSATTTGLRDVKLPVEVSVYPNPTLDGTLVIRHALNQPSVRLYDALGRQVNATVTHLNDGEIKVQLNAQGMVFGVVQDGQETGTFKVLVSKGYMPH
jgi:hypothetical protein